MSKENKIISFYVQPGFVVTKEKGEYLEAQTCFKTVIQLSNGRM